MIINKYSNKAGGVVFEVTSGNIERVLFITDEGISRHTDLENLNSCLNGQLSFSRHAMFDYKTKAELWARRLIEACGADEKLIQYLKNKIKEWGR